MSSPDPRAHDRSDSDYKPSGPEIMSHKSKHKSVREVDWEDPKILKTVRKQNLLNEYSGQTLKRVATPSGLVGDKGTEKSMKRHIAKKMKGNSDEAKNLRGKRAWFSHLDERARRRGETDL